MSLVLVGASPQVYAKLTLDEFCKMRYDLAFASISDRMDPSASLPELLKNFNILVEEAKTKQTYNKKSSKTLLMVTIWNGENGHLRGLRRVSFI